MKDLFRSTLHALAVALLCVLSLFVAQVHGPVVAVVAFVAGSAALVTPSMLPAGWLADVTLTPTVLLTNTLRKLFVKVPALGFFSSEFTTERVRLNQEVIGKIRVRPTSAQYDAAQGGYKNGSQEGKDLLKDITFTMDQHLHVTVSLSHLNALQDSIQKQEEHMEDSASVIGSEVCRYMLGKISSASFSNASIFSVANSDKDMLNDVRKKMNRRGVYGRRFGLINSDVAETLEGDARITNRYDDRSKETDADPYLSLMSLAGFQTIREDPELPTGNGTAIDITGEADTEVITTASAHGFLVNQRVKVAGLAGGSGIADGYFFVKTVPSTTTLTLSATRGGAVAAFTTDITGGTIEAAENMTSFFGTREAIAIKTALPDDSVQLARSLGIPTPVSDEVITDPDSGLSMIAYKWFETGPMDAYITLACLYGATAGALCDSEGHVMEPSGHILRSE